MKDDSYDCIGSSLDDFLKEEGIFEECEAAAIKSVIAWQLQNYMEKSHVSKTEIARRMGTSRSFVDKILDAKNTSITLATILKVGKIVGKPVRLDFGEAEAICAA
jgi:predicted XRE-type DNA-binding protein